MEGLLPPGSKADNLEVPRRNQLPGTSRQLCEHPSNTPGLRQRLQAASHPDCSTGPGEGSLPKLTSTSSGVFSTAVDRPTTLAMAQTMISATGEPHLSSKPSHTSDHSPSHKLSLDLSHKTGHRQDLPRLQTALGAVHEAVSDDLNGIFTMNTKFCTSDSTTRCPQPLLPVSFTAGPEKASCNPWSREGNGLSL